MTMTAMQPLDLVAEVVNVNGRTMIRVKHGPYLVGYYYNAKEVESALAIQGYSIADLIVKEQ